MAGQKSSSALAQPLRTTLSALRRVPGAETVGRAAGGALDAVGRVSPRGRRVAVYTGAGVLGVAGVVEWPVALTGAAVAWLTQARPGQREAGGAGSEVFAAGGARGAVAAAGGAKRTLSEAARRTTTEAMRATAGGGSVTKVATAAARRSGGGVRKAAPGHSTASHGGRGAPQTGASPGEQDAPRPGADPGASASSDERDAPHAGAEDISPGAGETGPGTGHS
jgi:hypothetical protein